MDYPVLHQWTPTLFSHGLSQCIQKEVWLKMECYQPVGSYKIRGVGRLCQYFHQQGARHLVASSAGNAGVAVAYAGKRLGLPTTVFVPKGTSPVFLTAMENEGARVKQVGATWDAANQSALRFAKKPKTAFVHPFDHELLWAGHATMIEEIATFGLKPDAIIVSVGGGGLAAGILQGMAQVGWWDVPLITVETKGAASFAKSMAKGRRVTLASINTIAFSLAVNRVTEGLWKWRDKHPIVPLTVTDPQAILACSRFAKDHRQLIEPSSGAALAVVYDKYPALADFKSLCVIVCGGLGISN